MIEVLIELMQSQSGRERPEGETFEDEQFRPFLSLNEWGYINEAEDYSNIDSCIAGVALAAVSTIYGQRYKDNW